MLALPFSAPMIFLAFLLLDAAVVIVGMMGSIADNSRFAILILSAAVLVWLLWTVVKSFISLWRTPP